MTARVRLKKEISGHVPLGTWHQEELIGGKPQVVK
jgi:hypothetical protein